MIKLGNKNTQGIKQSENLEDEALVWPIPALKEDLHYYMENGFMVFTENYHRARGSCCGNSCRHCPFGYVNVVNKS